MKRLLIITQKIDENDDILGFFIVWVKELAKYFKSIKIICLYKGEYNLPDNVEVVSLGKEDGVARHVYLGRFYKHIWWGRGSYDSVFVHMNPEYVVLGGLLWRVLNKRISLWYTHKELDLKLKIAAFFTDYIFTASRESCNLKSDKVKVVGHGIDISNFILSKKSNSKLSICYVGRLSQIKNQKLLVEAANIMRSKTDNQFEIFLAGDVGTERDNEYKDELIRLIKKYNLKDDIRLLGSVPYRKINDVYGKTDISINLCPTGGMDKAVLESMASGAIPLVYNKTFTGLFSGYSEILQLKKDEPAELADQILRIRNLDEEMKSEIRVYLREKVSAEHDVHILIKKISKDL